MHPATACLRRAWRDSQLTIAQIAARAEKSESTVYLVLAGKPTHADSVFAVAAALNVSALPVFPSSHEIRA